MGGESPAPGLAEVVIRGAEKELRAMARTPRVTLDRPDTNGPGQDQTATQAGIPEERVEISNADDRPTLDEIAEEAYAIYLANGSQDGFDIDHWLEAERRIQERKEMERGRVDVAADRPDDRA